MEENFTIYGVKPEKAQEVLIRLGEILSNTTVKRILEEEGINTEIGVGYNDKYNHVYIALESNSSFCFVSNFRREVVLHHNCAWDGEETICFEESKFDKFIRVMSKVEQRKMS